MRIAIHDAIPKQDKRGNPAERSAPTVAAKKSSPIKSCEVSNLPTARYRCGKRDKQAVGRLAGRTQAMGAHFLIFRDEEGFWCAATPGFQNIYLDPVGWGRTPLEAVEELKQHPGFQERARQFGWSTPAFADFVHVSDPYAYFENDPRPPHTRGRAEHRRLKVVSKN